MHVPAPSHTPGHFSPLAQGSMRQRNPMRSLNRWQVPSHIQPVQKGKSPQSVAFSHGHPSPPFAQAGSLHEGKMKKAGRRRANVNAATMRRRNIWASLDHVMPLHAAGVE
jgi:hypothetical protein